MKYKVELIRYSEMVVQVSAETPAAALGVAKAANYGFDVKAVTEILDGEKSGKTYELIDYCDDCLRPIFEGDKCARDEDGITLCVGCASPSKLTSS